MQRSLSLAFRPGHKSRRGPVRDPDTAICLGDVCRGRSTIAPRVTNAHATASDCKTIARECDKQAPWPRRRDRAHNQQ
ncbi:hypothetical protein J6590_017540 [Homalodisca vitripennis]|nr:hypothetical protein J6590_017540 [Homalodisca vitripennis]